MSTSTSYNYVFLRFLQHIFVSAGLGTYVVYLQIGANRMLDEWEENLAIITANRTKDDELVIIYLGDCLWKEHGEVCCMWFLCILSLFCLRFSKDLCVCCLILTVKQLYRLLLHTYVI